MERKVEKLVQDAIDELGYEDTFLVELKVSNNRVAVYLDSDESVTFEKCRKISRKMEAVLDEEKWLGEKYTLEVSSAGIGRPLVYPRQYVKNVGRQIVVKYHDGEKVKGEITGADEEKVYVEYEKTKKQGKKKIKVTESVMIPYREIKEAKIKVSF